MFKLKIILFLILVSFFLNFSLSAKATCLIGARVAEITTETREVYPGKEVQVSYLNLEIVRTEGLDCPVEQGQIFKVSDYTEGSLQKEDLIKGKIEAFSLTTPTGLMTGLHWSSLSYEDGRKIYIKNRAVIVNQLQSDDQPIFLKENQQLIEESNLETKQPVEVDYSLSVVLISLALLLLIYSLYVRLAIIFKWNSKK